MFFQYLNMIRYFCVPASSKLLLRPLQRKLFTATYHPMNSLIGWTQGQRDHLQRLTSFVCQVTYVLSSKFKHSHKKRIVWKHGRSTHLC